MNSRGFKFEIFHFPDHLRLLLVAGQPLLSFSVKLLIYCEINKPVDKWALKMFLGSLAETLDL